MYTLFLSLSSSSTPTCWLRRVTDLFLYSFLTFIDWSSKLAIISRKNKDEEICCRMFIFREEIIYHFSFFLSFSLFVISWLPIIKSKDRSIWESNLDGLDGWTRIPITLICIIYARKSKKKEYLFHTRVHSSTWSLSIVLIERAGDVIKGQIYQE